MCWRRRSSLCRRPTRRCGLSTSICLSDLVGGEPRDVLAAEEFAMPAPDEAQCRRPRPTRRRHGARLIAVCLVPVGVVVGVWGRKRRHGHRGRGD